MMYKSEFGNPDEIPAANGGAPEEDRTRDSRMARARGKVVEYANADDELKAQMERVMDPIDRAPNSFNAIIDYGHPPLKKLGDLANDMIKIQGKFNDQVNVLAGALEKLQGGLVGMDLHKFGEKTRELLKGLASGTAKGAKGIFKAGKNFFDVVSGRAAKRTEDEKLVKEMQEALPEMLFEMVKLVKNIEETDKGIQEVMKEAEKLGQARVEATRELGLYLGAAKEVLNRYNRDPDGYIAEAKRNFEETQDPEDEIYFKEVVKRKEDFIDRIAILEGSRAQSVIAAQQLRQMIETMEDQRKKIQNIVHNSQNEWKAMLAAAGIAGSSLKAAQTLKQADEFGDKMFDQTMKMIEDAQQMTLNGRARGTVDPAKLIEASARLQQMIEKENDERQKRLQTLEATSVALRGAADKLLEAAESSTKARLLEASEAAQKASEQQKTAEAAPTPAVNDNGEAKPKTGTGGPAQP